MREKWPDDAKRLAQEVRLLRDDLIVLAKFSTESLDMGPPHENRWIQELNGRISFARAALARHLSRYPDQLGDF